MTVYTRGVSPGASVNVSGLTFFWSELASAAMHAAEQLTRFSSARVMWSGRVVPRARAVAAGH